MATISVGIIMHGVTGRMGKKSASDPLHRGNS